MVIEGGEPFEDRKISMDSTREESWEHTMPRNLSRPVTRFSSNSMSCIYRERVCAGALIGGSANSSPRYGLNARLLRPGAMKINFIRNGYCYFKGITMSVSALYHRNFDVLLQEVTRRMQHHITLRGPIYTIYSQNGKKVSRISDFVNGESYYCATKKEPFKPFDMDSLCATFRSPNAFGLGRDRHIRYSLKRRPRYSIAKAQLALTHSRIVSLICNGIKPRRILRYLISPRTVRDFNQLLSDISEKVCLPSGAVRKVYTLNGKMVERLEHFYEQDAVFIVFGQERVNHRFDFLLHDDEHAILSKLGTKSSHFPLSVNQALSSKKFLNCEDDIPTEHWPVVLRSQYKVCEVIGRGEFSTVLKVLHTPTNKFYALKVVEKYVHKTRQFADNEKSIHQSVSHEFILRLIRAFEHSKWNYLLTAYMADGDLFRVLDMHERHKMSVPQTKLVIRQLGEALYYLHNRVIVHRDVKPENILVELDGNGLVKRIKLADFGLACVVYNKLYTMCGSVLYIAPEVLTHVGYGRKVDIWATGALMYMLLHGVPPFEPETSRHNDKNLYRKIKCAAYKVDKAFDATTHALIANLMEKDPCLRYTAEDLVNDAWFRTE